MLTGSMHSPFHAVTDYITSQKIVAGDYSWPIPGCMDQNAMSLATNLMQRVPQDRLGCATGNATDAAPAETSTESGSNRDLWLHPLLASINEQELHTLSPPLPRSNEDVNLVTRQDLCLDATLP